MTQPALKTNFQQLKVLHLALIVGDVLMAFMVYTLTQSGADTADRKVNLLAGWTPVAIALFAAQAMAAYFLWQQMMNRIPHEASIQEKLAHYRKSCILRWALINSANIIVIVIAFLDAKPLLLFLLIAGVAMLWLARPSLDFFEEQYRLQPGERHTIEQ